VKRPSIKAFAAGALAIEAIGFGPMLIATFQSNMLTPLDVVDLVIVGALVAAASYAYWFALGGWLVAAVLLGFSALLNLVVAAESALPSVDATLMLPAHRITVVDVLCR
jgi:hypothetical protein